MSRILFVDDDLRLLSALRRTFRRVHPEWHCTFATSAEEALDTLKHSMTDVLVTDMAMDGMNGLDLARQVHAVYPSIATIILTGTADLGSAVDAINQARVFRFYTKPCPTERLTEGIADALGISSGLAAAATLGAGNFGPSALNLLPLGILLVDQDGRVEFMNNHAAALIAQRDGLQVGSNGILRAASASLTKALHLAIQNAFMTTIEHVEDIALALTRTSGKRSLNVFVAAGQSSEASGVLNRAMVFVTDPERPTEPSERILREMFDLTHAEARLVRALMYDGELGIAAKTSNITLQTARSYLKRIFDKTGTSRQAQLVKLVLTSPAMLSRSPDS